MEHSLQVRTATWPLRPRLADGARREVRVHKPLGRALEEDDYVFLEDRLETQLERLPADFEMKHEWITVDGQVHSAATLYLASLADLPGMSAQTRAMRAACLRQWIDFLLNEKGLDDRNEFKSDVFIAAMRAGQHDHLAAYRLWMIGGAEGEEGRPAEQGGPIQETSFGPHHAAIVGLHDFLAGWMIPRPFEKTKKFIDGHLVESTGFGARGSVGSQGQPLAPSFVKILEHAVKRIDANGEMHPTAASRRDFAFIQWGLATGMRVNGLWTTTIYEVPAAPDPFVHLVEVRVPDKVTKGARGGKAWAFEHRIEHVREYISGKRKLVLDALRDSNGKPWRYSPKKAIQITAADFDGWKGVDSNGDTIEKTWNDSGEGIRRRLVTPDGFPAMIWITSTGKPISLRQARKLVRKAATRANKLDSRFPKDVTTHDLRHTYACNLALVMLHGVLAAITGRPGYRPYDVEDALSLVSLSLGHEDTRTTRKIYLHTFTSFYLSEPNPGDLVKAVLGR